MTRDPRRLWHLMGLAIATVLLLAACGSDATSPAPSDGQSSAAATAETTPASDVTRGGELRMQLIRDSDTGYDPALQSLSTVYTINGLIFDTLLEVEPDGTLAPSLAESWTVSPDELTYTFKIRSDVVFHNGRSMTADDVKYTLDRLRDPETNSPRRGVYSSVASVEAPDATTVVVTLSEPYAPLLAVLADISAGIVPREVVEAQGDLNANPVGTGPFKFVEWVQDQHVKLEANPDYWREGLPYLNAVTFTFNGDANARAANLRSQTVDFLWNAPPELRQVLGADPSLQVYGGEGTQSFEYLLLNMQKPPFDDIRVRQAIYWALDREEMRQISRPDTTTAITTGFLPPTHWAGVKETHYTQNIDKAKGLLADAGLADGFPMEILVLSGSDFHIRSAQAAQQQLKAVGIDVTVTTVDSGQQTSRRKDGDFDGIITGFSGTIDPDQRFSQTFFTGGGTNYVKFSDAKVDDLILQARATSDREAKSGTLPRGTAPYRGSWPDVLDLQLPLLRCPPVVCERIRLQPTARGLPISPPGVAGQVGPALWHPSGGPTIERESDPRWEAQPSCHASRTS